MHTGSWLRAITAISSLFPAAAHATSVYDRKDAELFCVEACQSGVQSVEFNDTKSGTGFPAVCHSEIAGWSLLLCARLFCEDGATAGERLGELNATCEAAGGVLPSLRDAKTYPEEDLEKLTRLTVDNRTNHDVVGEYVVPAESFFSLWVETLSATEYVYRFHNIYGWAMGVYWAVIVLIGLLARYVSTYRHKRSVSKPESRLAAWYKANVSVPMAFGSACGRDVGWATVPPRDQAFAAILFAALNVVLSSIGYQIFEGNLYYPSRTSQILRYVSDRTGIISFANFPLIWLFGTRNNVVSWVTGWDFPTCTNFHRWVARVATVQAVIHSIGYTILVIREGGWSRFSMWWTYQFWWAGELATVFMCALVALSFYWVRKKHYETFLVSHIVLSILILVTMLMHVAIFNGTYDPLVIVPVVIWLSDRVLRTIRIGLFNPAFWSTKAAATYDRDANLVRLEISMAQSFYKFSPGTYCYLMVLHDRTWWQSHPFTIASVKSSKKRAAATETLGEESDEQGPLLQPRASFELADAAADGGALRDDQDKAIILVRPYDQFTGRLRDLASEKSGVPATLRVVVEGPYGQTRPLGRFDKVLFLTGGSGIAIPLSYLEMLFKKGSRSIVSSVGIHWAVREAAFAAKTVSEDMEEYLRDERFSVVTYTSAATYRADNDILAEMEAMSEKVEARRERLDCAERIAEAVQSMEVDGKRNLAVVCCGPAGMADDCRAAVAREVRAGRGRIEYFEESYNW